jgi:hypothetical protein
VPLGRTRGTRLALFTVDANPNEQEVAMSFILWLIVGGLLGWLASMIMGTNDR